jgi:hypothetical protein
MADTTLGSTTLDPDLYPCGAANRTAIIQREDRSNFIAVIVSFACCLTVMWVIFGVWHGVTRCAFWRKLKARHLFETRAQCCRPCTQSRVSVRASRGASCCVRWLTLGLALMINAGGSKEEEDEEEESLADCLTTAAPPHPAHVCLPARPSRPPDRA